MEEALELAQACGCPAEDALPLVHYICSQPPSTIGDEVGGAILTIAAPCGALGVDMGDGARGGALERVAAD
ncbi:hypothetical protein [Agreia sp.]|uniref:hypothetical protein n=1 Tax=Agreia sp. TaxID=1872416 RepID=UPI0035BC10A6